MKQYNFKRIPHQLYYRKADSFIAINDYNNKNIFNLLLQQFIYMREDLSATGRRFVLQKFPVYTQSV
jgi:hypothetical protein